MTIYALSTPALKSALAVIRVSGDDACRVFDFFNIKKPKERVAVLRKIINPKTGEVIDHALVLYFKAPHSFTGEDTVEFHIHGSKAVISELLSCLSEIEGFRMAEEGEFTKRAVLNGKFDLTEAEAIGDLIAAETSMQKNQALSQLEGGFRDVCEKWRADLITILSLVEAYIDFPEEDIPEDTLTQINGIISNTKEEIQEHLKHSNVGQKIREGINIAIIGAPNAGKSSLINYLVGSDIAIVSETAGTTRDFLEAYVDLGGYPVTFIDTAGLRETEEHIEKEGVKRAYERASDADFKIAMFDATTEPDSKTLEMLDERTIVVFNKVDRCQTTDDRQQRKDEIKNKQSDRCQASLSRKVDVERIEADGGFLPLKGRHPPFQLQLSLKTNFGTDTLINTIKQKITDEFSPSSTSLITRERHRVNLQKCIDELTLIPDLLSEAFSKRYVQCQMPVELIAEHIRMASRYIGKITGHIDIEEVLDEIFSNFCIGK